jgi:hypothetical protein
VGAADGELLQRGHCRRRRGSDRRLLYGGCTGTITTFVDSGHAGAENLRAVFAASYTDTPADPDVPPLTGSDEVVLTPAV